MLADVTAVIDAARHRAARSVNAIMTATYWAIGRRIVEHEQQGSPRAEYGEETIARLSRDLPARYGRGFRRANLFQMKAVYLAYREILQTASGELGRDDALQKVQTLSGLFLAAEKCRLRQQIAASLKCAAKHQSP